MTAHPPSSAPTRFVEVQPGKRLHCTMAGTPQGAADPFVHGFSELWEVWKDVLPAFADRRHAASRNMNWLRRPGSEAALAADGFALLERAFRGGTRPTCYDTPARAAYDAA